MMKLVADALNSLFLQPYSGLACERFILWTQNHWLFSNVTKFHKVCSYRNYGDWLTIQLSVVVMLDSLIFKKLWLNFGFIKVFNLLRFFMFGLYLPTILMNISRTLLQTHVFWSTFLRRCYLYYFCLNWPI